MCSCASCLAVLRTFRRRSVALILLFDLVVAVHCSELMVASRWFALRVRMREKAVLLYGRTQEGTSRCVSRHHKKLEREP